MKDLISFMITHFPGHMFVPESCMKINEKFEFYLITTGCAYFGSKEKYLMGKKNDG